MSLEDYFKRSGNSLIREAIINHRLCYDLKLEAAFQEYNLIVYRPDIDISGYDLVFDDGLTNRKIQIKTVLNNSTTKKWDIDKLLLAPTNKTLKSFGNTMPEPWIGLEGGFILAEVCMKSTKKELSVNYSYADFFTIAMKSLGIHNIHKHGIAHDRTEQLKTIGYGKIAITKRLMIPAISSMHLLALMGLRSQKIYNWHSAAIQFYRINLGVEQDKDVTQHAEIMKKKIEEALSGEN